MERLARLGLTTAASAASEVLTEAASSSGSEAVISRRRMPSAAAPGEAADMVGQQEAEVLGMLEAQRSRHWRRRPASAHPSGRPSADGRLLPRASSEDVRMFQLISRAAAGSDAERGGARSEERTAEAFGRGVPLTQTLAEPCCICLEPLAQRQVALTLRCGHVFHQECIWDWLGRRASCPLCKQSVI